ERVLVPGERELLQWRRRPRAAAERDRRRGERGGAGRAQQPAACGVVRVGTRENGGIGHRGSPGPVVRNGAQSSRSGSSATTRAYRLSNACSAPSGPPICPCV
ncbi:hypothetical protein BMUNKI379_06245, partial [Burkholderia multivorans]